MSCERGDSVRAWRVDNLAVSAYADRQAMGIAAAQDVVNQIRCTLASKERVHMVFAAAPSQNEFLEALVASEGVDWSRVVALHLDEYTGLPADASQRFSNYLQKHLFTRVGMGEVFLMDGNAEPVVECRRYAALLAEYPLDIACIGIGENGHIAFNDPPVADFSDLEIVKVVELERRCREQQVNDGCFASLAEVPTHALTMTIPSIMAAKGIFCIVPGPTKREAVDCTLNGPVTTQCPASILRTHQAARLYLDLAAAERVM